VILDAEAIRRALPPDLRALRLHVFDEVDSTNRVGRVQAAAGAVHGTVIVADRQSAGVGRGSRSWHSPAGLGLWATIILHSSLPARALGLLPLAVGVGTAAALEVGGPLRIGLKWPNDLLTGGRKLGGILVESSLRTDRLAWAVAGIGINVSAAETDFPPALRASATSLVMAGAPLVTREALLGRVVTEVLASVQALERNAAGVLEAFRRRDVLVGRSIVVDRGGEELRGKAGGISDEGALIVHSTAGPCVIFDGTIVSFEP
jgi:BirA family biotin operon repressor/biotin-[acetyl-CoA-carboxylase] ligase